nr:hypothetical protein [uncultured Acetatifactor sp.]
MTKQKGSANNAAIANEIINNAVDLPLESQKVILMIAKSMKYARDCMIEHGETERRCKS